MAVGEGDGHRPRRAAVEAAVAARVLVAIPNPLKPAGCSARVASAILGDGRVREDFCRGQGRG